MDIEEEIAQGIASAFFAMEAGYTPTEAWEIPTPSPGDRALAAALMPLVKRAQADEVREVADLVMDPRDGLPFDGDHDLAIVSAWLKEAADRIEKEAGE